MKKTILILAAAVIPAVGAATAAQEFYIDTAGLAAAEVPPAAPSAESSPTKAGYYEYYAALQWYSDIAFNSPQDSPAYLEASAAGRYLRARLEAMATESGGAPSSADLERFAAGNKAAPFSWTVMKELNDAFGADKQTAKRVVQIKAGYCQINYVKGNTPFLVQHDGFLKKGEIILTFDDGPGPLTKEIAAAMQAGMAPSLFFVLGSKLDAGGKEIVRNAAVAGHEAAVHGHWHATKDGRPFTALSTAETLKQLGGVKNTVTAAAGAAPRFFRPPYGVISPEALKAIYSDLGLIPLGWTIDTLDWSTKDPDELFDKTVSMIQRRGKGIVLMHDIHPQSRTAAKRLVKWLADNGYTVVSPDRLAQAYGGKETGQ